MNLIMFFCINRSEFTHITATAARRSQSKNLVYALKKIKKKIK